MYRREQLTSIIHHLENQKDTLDPSAVDYAIQILNIALEKNIPTISPLRQQIIVMRANITGLKQLVDDWDTEGVLNIMKRVWGRLDAIILERGGLIDKHIGNTIIALWGVNQSREDNAIQAVHAALEMKTALSELNQWHDLLTLKIGIHAGAAVVGNIGKLDEFIALGQTLKIAQLVEEHAESNSIIISHDTYRQIRGFFNLEHYESLLAVEGKAVTIPTYRVLGSRPRTFHLTPHGVEGIETQTVGREAEQGTLQTAFDRLIHEPQPQCITVVGEAGIGKSRLIYDFLNWIEPHPVQVWLFRGRASEQLTFTPYALLRDIIYDRLEIKNDEPPALAWAKLRQELRQFLGDSTDTKAAWIAHLIGLQTDDPLPEVSSEQVRQRAIGAMTEFLTAMYQQTAPDPIVMAVEDIHWADEGSLQILAELQRHCLHIGWLLVWTTRPEIFERRINLSWGQLIRLKPLTENQCSRLVSEILQKIPELPQSFVQQLVHHAEGNPLYLEELIKMLIDDQVIAMRSTLWRLDLARFSDLRLPNTLAAVLQKRWDSLTHNYQIILQEAACIGRVFWDQALASVMGMRASEANFATDFAQLTQNLTYLVDRGFLVKRGDTDFEGSFEYRFSHVMIYDFVYQTLPWATRTMGHQAVAEWLLQRGGERTREQAERLAHHYQAAENFPQAVYYLSEAGQQALQTSAFGEAMKLFEKALQLQPEDQHLHYFLGKTQIQLGAYTEAKQHLQVGLSGAPDDHLQVDLLTELGIVAWRQGDFEEASLHFEQALHAAQTIAYTETIPYILRHQGAVARANGDYEAAAKLAQEAFQHYETLENRNGMVSCLILLGTLHHFLGDDLACERTYTQALMLTRELQDHWHEALLLGNLGETARVLQNYEVAADWLIASSKVWEEIGNQQGLAVNSLSLGQVALGKRDLPLAQKHLEEALRRFKAIQARSWILSCIVAWAQIEIELEHWEEALQGITTVWGQPALTDESRQTAQKVLLILEDKLKQETITQALENTPPPLEAFLAKILAEYRK